MIIIYEFIIPKNKNERHNYLTVINPDYYNMSIYSSSSYQWPKSESSYTTYIIVGAVLIFIILFILIRLICKTIINIRIKKVVSSNPLCENADP